MESAGRILNDIKDLEEYKKSYPTIMNQEDGALHEIHIFLSPTNPSQELVDKAMQLTQKFNKDKVGDLQEYTMKMCYLSLVYRNIGPVKVLQSARYYRSNNQDKVIEQAYCDANFFAEYGFDVSRVKIEANAHFNEGVPQVDEDTNKFQKYFEFHIKVAYKQEQEIAVISEEESKALMVISEKFTKIYKTPVPLSWNNAANCNNPDNPGYQRFLNIRFRDKGLNSCKLVLSEIRNDINQNTNFKQVKSIDEYVWFDTCTEMDRGWIDFSQEELQLIVV